jgi:hypothetical protein
VPDHLGGDHQEYLDAQVVGMGNGAPPNLGAASVSKNAALAHNPQGEAGGHPQPAREATIPAADSVLDFIFAPTLLSPIKPDIPDNWGLMP